MTAWAEINKKMKSIWDEFIYGGHLLSFGLMCMVLLSAILLDVKISFEFLAVIYLLTLGPCLFGRYVDLRSDALTNPERSRYLSKKANRIPYMIAICIVVIVSILTYGHKPMMVLFGIGLILLSFFYDLFLKGITKKIIGFKNIFVGLLFSLLIVMMGLYYDIQFNLSFLLVFIFIFIMTAMGAAFSDIKDIKSDKEEGLKTLAIVLGHKRLIDYLLLTILLSLMPIFIGVYIGLLPVYALMLTLVLPYNMFLFNESFRENKNSDFLYAVLFDSQLILWLVFILAGKVLT